MSARRGGARDSCRKTVDLWTLLLTTIAFQVLVCMILIPVLLLSDGSRRLCELSWPRDDRRCIRDSRVFHETSTSSIISFGTNHSVSSVPDLIREKECNCKGETPSSSQPKKTNSNHLSHIPRPFTILTTTNRGFADFAINWLSSIRQLGLDYNVTIIAEDSAAYRYLTQNLTLSSDHHLRIAKTEYGSSSSEPQKFMRSGYRRLVNKRPQYLVDKLEEGFDILLVDVDSVWFKDPLNLIIPNYTKYDIWLAQGHDGKDGHPLPCPCLMYLKSDSVSFGIVRHWINRLRKVNGVESDQQSLNNILKTRHGQRLRIGWLDNSKFPTGDQYKKRQQNNETMENVYIFHANHMGNAAMKKDYMKSNGLWSLDSV